MLLAGKNCFSQLILRHNSSALDYPTTSICTPHFKVTRLHPRSQPKPQTPSSILPRTRQKNPEELTYQNCGKLSPLSLPLSSSSLSRSLSLPPCFAALHPGPIFAMYCGVPRRLSGAGLPFFSLVAALWSFPLFLLEWCLFSEELGCFSESVRGERGGGVVATEWVRTGGGRDCASLAV